MFLSIYDIFQTNEPSIRVCYTYTPNAKFSLFHRTAAVQTRGYRYFYHDISKNWTSLKQMTADKDDNKLYFRHFTPFRLLGFSQQTGTNGLTLISNTSWLKSDPSSCKKTVSALLGTRPDWWPAPNVGDLEKRGWRESTSGFPSIICVVRRPAPKNSAGSDVNVQTGL